MSASNESAISRRGFLAGFAALGAMGAVGLAGCASERPADSNALADTADSAPVEADEVVDADIVIIGAGASGLACAVQAAQDGLKTLLLEKAGEIGGNCNGTEGIFAIGSRIQKAQGIEIDPSSVVRRELEFSHFRANGSMWLDMINSSADNLAWLEENGVAFKDEAEGMPPFLTGHRFKDEAGANNYVPPMAAAAESAGADIKTGMRATKLICDDGIVRGVYATAEDGSILQVNAPAVVLATGGVGCNKELLVGQGWTQEKLDTMMVQGVPSVEGDGYLMAMEAGAKDFLPNAALQAFNGVPAFGFDSTPPYSSTLNSAVGIAAGGPSIWVNEDAVRFNDESLCFTYNMAATATALMCNKDNYLLFDQAILDSCVQDKADRAAVDAALDGSHDDSIFKADDVRVLAENFQLDADALASTFERYNTFCAEGTDLDFGKNPAFLKPLDTPPFYLAKISNLLIAVDGGVTTNARAEALDHHMNPIPGLYAVGLDGAMLWRNVYTQAIGGTMMGNNVYSGRNAARNAKEYIATL
ncbi:FAD-dependent oxidoreductase [Eggerthellaceae bacterium 24-137]